MQLVMLRHDTYCAIVVAAVVEKKGICILSTYFDFEVRSITDELLSMESLCAIMDAENPPKKRGPYKKAEA